MAVTAKPGNSALGFERKGNIHTLVKVDAEGTRHVIPLTETDLGYLSQAVAKEMAAVGRRLDPTAPPDSEAKFPVSVLQYKVLPDTHRSTVLLAVQDTNLNETTLAFEPPAALHVAQLLPGVAEEVRASREAMKKN